MLDSWCGETHVQKAAYVLQELLEVTLGFHFILYKFGPFSFDLRDELTVLRADGLLKLEPQAPPYGPRFAATDLSEDLRKRFPRTMENHGDQIEFVAEALKSKRVAELERLATALYVTREIGNDVSVKARADALVQQKPHVSSDEAEAAVGRDRPNDPRSQRTFSNVYSTVTLLARFLGWSTSVPRSTAMW